MLEAPRDGSGRRLSASKGQAVQGPAMQACSLPSALTRPDKLSFREATINLPVTAWLYLPLPCQRFSSSCWTPVVMQCNPFMPPSSHTPPSYTPVLILSYGVQFDSRKSESNILRTRKTEGGCQSPQGCDADVVSFRCGGFREWHEIIAHTLCLTRRLAWTFLLERPK